MKTHLLLIPTLLLLGTAPLVQSHAQTGGQATTEAQKAAVQREVQKIIAQAKGDPAMIAALTASEIVANGENLSNAAAIAAGVLQATGIKGDLLAAAIGQQFATHRELIDKAPDIAAALVKVILAKGNTPAIGAEAAVTVATLVTSLPGTAQNNQAIITQIGQAVSTVVASNPDVAVAVVGETVTNLKSSSGSSDVSSVLTSFADAVSNGNNALNTRLQAVVASVNAGNPYTSLPTSPNIANHTNNGTTNSGLSSGPTNQQESQFTN